MLYFVQFSVNFSLNFRVVQQEQEGPHQAGGGGLHAGQEEVDHSIEERVVAWIRKYD